MAARILDISDVTHKYKVEQRFFSQWVMKTFSVLNISCTKYHHTSSETRSEPSIRELRCVTDDIAIYIRQTKSLPEGTRDALNLMFTQLADRRECAALFRAQTLEDGQNRSKEDAGHQKAIEDFNDIHETLQTAVIFALSYQTLPLLVANRSNRQDDNTYEFLDGSRSRVADGTTVPLEQRGTLSVASADTTSTSLPPDYESTILKCLEALAPIRRSVRATWNKYQAGKSGLYETSEITRHAFALSLGVVAELQAILTESKVLLDCFVRPRKRPQ